MSVSVKVNPLATGQRWQRVGLLLGISLCGGILACVSDSPEWLEVVYIPGMPINFLGAMILPNGWISYTSGHGGPFFVSALDRFIFNAIGYFLGAAIVMRVIGALYRWKSVDNNPQ